MRITIFVCLAVCLPVRRAQETAEEAVELPLPAGVNPEAAGTGGGGGAGAGDVKPGASDEDDIYEDETTNPSDNYISVALIDIVFTDGCKRTCTGAIIHDNVVITAAHCFTMLRDNYMQPELTMSFVVIGTKIMFDTGYEQYLPIERVITHERFKGWTADLALVYTFAGMISDKPGQILRISVQSNAPVDSNVTVLSWGRCKGQEYKDDEDGSRVTESGLDGGSGESRPKKRKRRRPGLREGPDSYHNKDTRTPYQSRFRLKKNDQSGARGVIKMQVANRDDERRERPRVRRAEGSTVRSRYLGASDRAHMKGVRGDTDTTTNVVASLSEETKFSNDKYLFQTIFDDGQRQKPMYSKTKISDKRVMRPHHRVRRSMPKAKSVDDLARYRNWRRSSGTQHNNLTVGTFGYVNLAACKKIVERTLPPLYEINNKNEVLCYSSEEFYITNEDSGAPVILKDHLVAVTVGGVDSNGDHVAVGMKISCFCSWIAENLPNGDGEHMKCCTNCCSDTSKKERALRQSENIETPHTRLRDQKRQIGVHRFKNRQTDSGETEGKRADDSTSSEY